MANSKDKKLVKPAKGKAVAKNVCKLHKHKKPANLGERAIEALGGLLVGLVGGIAIFSVIAVVLDLAVR